MARVKFCAVCFGNVAKVGVRCLECSAAAVRSAAPAKGRKTRSTPNAENSANGTPQDLDGLLAAAERGEINIDDLDALVAGLDATC